MIDILQFCDICNLRVILEIFSVKINNLVKTSMNTDLQTGIHNE